MPVPDFSNYIQANTQGRLHDAAEGSISPLDRGFLYGDAIYEVWRTYSGVVYAWDEHWARLQQSARALGLVVAETEEQIWHEVRQTVKAFRDITGFTSDVYIRLQISRGAGAIGLNANLATGSRFVILVKPSPELSARQRAAGLQLHVATQLRRNPQLALNPAWKTGNYLNNLLALREATEIGADDVLLLNLAGNFTEASTSNLAIIKDGTVVTPPLSAGILAGITRHTLIHDVAPAAGISVLEQDFGPVELAQADEVFIMSTTRDFVPVAQVGEHKFLVHPGSLTERLKAHFAEHVRVDVARHDDRLV